MPVSQEKKTHKNMRLLRLRFDEVDRKYQADANEKTPKKKEVEAYVEVLRGLIDRACRNSGFNSKPVLIDRKKGKRVELGEDFEKGSVRRR